MGKIDKVARRASFGAVGALVAAGLAVPALVAPAGAAVAKDVTFKCHTFGTDFDYVTDVNITAKRVAGSAAVTLTAVLDDITGINIPVPLDDLKHDGEMKVSVGSASTTLKGTRAVAQLPASTPVPVPTMTGAIAAAGNKIDVVVTDADFKAFAGMEVDIPCSLEAPVTVAGVDVVTTQPPKPPVARPAASKAKVTAKATKKQVVVKVKVTSSAKVSGQTQIVVKKGKKTVAKKKVKVNKKGVAALKLKTKQINKKLKGKTKGKYQVNAKYLGSAQVKGSQGKTAFKLK